jgi:hypothetical protein
VSGRQSLNHFAHVKFSLSALQHGISLNFVSRFSTNSYKISLLIAMAMLPIFSYYTYNSALAMSTPFAFLDPFTGSLNGNESGVHGATNASTEIEICFDNKDNNGNGEVDETCSSESIMEVMRDMMTCTLGLNQNCGLTNTTGPVGGESIQSASNSLPQPEPEPEICNDKEDNNGDGQVDENCNSAVSDSDSNVDNKNNPPHVDKSTKKVDTPKDEDKVDIPTNGKDKSDKFGIREIYPSKADGEKWFINSNPEDDPRFSPQTQLTPNSDGSFKVKSTKVRMGVFTSSGYHPADISTLDHSKIAVKGYMQSPNDWRDLEITGYVKVNSGSGDNFAWYARGGRHTGNGNPEGCEGVAYKGGLYYNGETRWAKEQWHSGGYVFSENQKSVGPLNGKWVGFKTIMYNIQEGGKTAVKLEIWLDKDNNNKWVKVNERVDSGGWGNNGGECGGEPDQIISWGGPIATFRWDSASDVDIKNFSVREIQPNL